MKEEMPKKCKYVNCDSKRFVNAGKGGHPKRQSYKCKGCKKTFLIGDNRKGRKIPKRECFDKKVVTKANKLLIIKNKSESIITKLEKVEKDKEKKILKKQLEILKEKNNHRIYYTFKQIKEELEKKYPDKKIPKISTLSVWGKKYKSIE